MQSDPTTLTPTPIDMTLDPTAKIATELIASNVTAMTDKVQKVIEMIVGPNAKKYGVTANNLQLLFMFAGIAMVTPKIKELLVGDKHTGKKGRWPVVLGTVVALIALRKVLGGSTPVIPSMAVNSPNIALPSPVAPLALPIIPTVQTPNPTV